MNTASRNTDQLDSFETALLAELRQHVAEHPVPAVAPVRRPRVRLRLAAVGATGIAASVVAVFGLGGSGGSPAFAVAENGDGDVVVTVHRLDDAAGLEKALEAKGIDAEVSYDADGFGDSFGVGPDGTPRPGDELPPPPTGGQGDGPTSVESGSIGSGQDDSGPSLTESGPGVAGAGPGDDGSDPCGLGADPATLTQEGGDWVLRIPADSPLQDRHVAIGTDSSGALSVVYAGDEPRSTCGMVSMTRGAPPA